MIKLSQTNSDLILKNKNSLNHKKVKILDIKNSTKNREENIFLINSTHNHQYRKKTSLITNKKININLKKIFEKIKHTFDIIILDLPDPKTPELSHFYSPKFYTYIYKKLNNDGLIIQQATSVYYSKKVFISIGKTIKKAGFEILPFHDYIPSYGDWGWWVAGKETYYSTKDLYNKVNNIKTLSIPLKYLTTQLIKKSLIFSKDPILDIKEKDLHSKQIGNIYLQYFTAWKSL